MVSEMNVEPIEPVDLTFHSEQFGFGATFFDQFDGACAIVGRVAIQQHVRIGTLGADQVRPGADPSIHPEFRA